MVATTQGRLKLRVMVWEECIRACRRSFPAVVCFGLALPFSRAVGIYTCQEHLARLLQKSFIDIETFTKFLRRLIGDQINDRRITIDPNVVRIYHSRPLPRKPSEHANSVPS